MVRPSCHLLGRFGDVPNKARVGDKSWCCLYSMCLRSATPLGHVHIYSSNFRWGLVSVFAKSASCMGIWIIVLRLRTADVQ